MTREDVVHRLETTPRYDYMVEQGGSVIIEDLHVGAEGDHPITRFTEEAMLELTWPEVCRHATQGRDVEHITRVTGYFSKTSGWNKGKTAELKDRYRTRVGGR